MLLAKPLLLQIDKLQLQGLFWERGTTPPKQTDSIKTRTYLLMCPDSLRVALVLHQVLGWSVSAAPSASTVRHQVLRLET